MSETFYQQSLPDLAATAQFAVRLAPYLRVHDVITLQGQLGAGKTTFARALLQALGVTGEVPSPTFTLVQNYLASSLSIFHFDFYRLKQADELEEIGWDDACAEGLVLVEWPERAITRMPHDRLALSFGIDKTSLRHVTIEPHGAWLERLKGFVV